MSSPYPSSFSVPRRPPPAAPAASSSSSSSSASTSSSSSSSSGHNNNSGGEWGGGAGASALPSFLSSLSSSSLAAAAAVASTSDSSSGGSGITKPLPTPPAHRRQTTAAASSSSSPAASSAPSASSAASPCSSSSTLLSTSPSSPSSSTSSSSSAPTTPPPSSATSTLRVRPPVPLRDRASTSPSSSPVSSTTPHSASTSPEGSGDTGVTGSTARVGSSPLPATKCTPSPSSAPAAVAGSAAPVHISAGGAFGRWSASSLASSTNSAGSVSSSINQPLSRSATGLTKPATLRSPTSTQPRPLPSVPPRSRTIGGTGVSANASTLDSQMTTAAMYASGKEDTDSRAADDPCTPSEATAVCMDGDRQDTHATLPQDHANVEVSHQSELYESSNTLSSSHDQSCGSEHTGTEGYLEDEEVYERQDGSFRRADGTYGYWGSDSNYYVGFWGEDGQFHEGYRDSANVYWEGYWTDDGLWVDLSAASPTNSTSLGSSYSSILSADISGTQDTIETTSVALPKEEQEEISDEEKKEAKRVRMQRYVIDEIIATERDYVKDLTFVVERYQRPLAKLGVIDAAQCTGLFSNIHVLKGINESLLVALERHDSEHASVDIGSIFSEISPYFKIYSQYINNIDRQERLFLHLIKTNSDFRAFCDSVRVLPESKSLDLPAYLAKPMQRICKYPLLFRELVRYTLPNSPECRKLEEVSETVAAVAKHINEMKAKAENQQKLAQIQSRIDGSTMFTLVTATRRYIQEGSFTIQYNESSPGKKGLLFLFSDAMLFATTASLSSKLKPKRFILIDDLIEVVDVEDSEHHIFEIVDHNPKVPVVTRVFAESKEHKTGWVRAISEVLCRSGNAELKALQNLRPAVSASQERLPRPARPVREKDDKEEKKDKTFRKKTFIARRRSAAVNKDAISVQNPVPLPSTEHMPPPLTAAGTGLSSLASFPFPPLNPQHSSSPTTLPQARLTGPVSFPIMGSGGTSILMNELNTKLGNRRGSATTST